MDQERSPAPAIPATGQLRPSFSAEGALGILEGSWSGPEPLVDLAVEPATAIATGVAEMDRVLCGGLVPGSVTVIGGEPGVGKSTLLLQALGSMAESGLSVLLHSAEESAAQVRLRADRLGTLSSGLLVSTGTDLDSLLGSLESWEVLNGGPGPAVVAVDSVQTVTDASSNAPAGSIAQVRLCASCLVRMAKRTGCAVILVGHVTKDGSLAGPRTLEHLVDTVLSFEGDRHHSLRLLRSTKHRFGPAGELGMFQMGSSGLEGVEDPGKLLLADRRPGVAGSVMVPVLQGRRVMLVEVQALVAESSAPVPRRFAQGLDAGRMSLVLAVLESQTGLRLGRSDVFASVAGGVKVSEPAADLALALAVSSAATHRCVPPDLVAIGEIGLSGEIRQVDRLEGRLGEAERLGFCRAMVPASSDPAVRCLPTLRTSGLKEAIELVYS